ncbi:siderophore-interacting protein [Cellulomonas bogoriensis]|uniref:Iron-chelator utilization protein n=1 Tax=Cellulomonas bogoriensis 69B4 = DSM 16987 TaxID=1386082 RepID=A0A0A0C024_9CELL|nr:siderophore-interacting protein [Cellulomonas bogoriensis]KGM13550.1 iron-chelator utilization protein [Cellulomonas bogoriensis 69B4 = DSM 16987]
MTAPASETATDALTSDGATAPDPVRRVPHPPTARRLTVSAVQDLGPRLRRVTLTGSDLAGFRAWGPLDHVKVFFPGPQGLVVPVVEEGRWVNREDPALLHRDYTVRTFDPTVGLVLDMVVHDHGPAGRWTARAAPGQELATLGPRGSALPPLDRDRYVLAADETGLPALLNWLDRLPTTADVVAHVEVQDEADELPEEALGGHRVTWHHRRGAAPGTTTLLPDAVAGTPLGDGTVWAWAAGETAAVRAIRTGLAARGLRRDSFAMTGYWRRGVANFDHHSPEA